MPDTPAIPPETPTDRGAGFARRHALFLVLPLCMVSAWGGWSEWEHYRQAGSQVERDARRAAASYALGIADRLDTQFVALQFGAESLRGSAADLRHPDPRALAPLERYLALNPELAGLDILSADGSTMLWSARSAAPVSTDAFLPFSGNPNLLLGRATAASDPRPHVLPMRVLIADAGDGYLVETGYRLSALLVGAPSQDPWSFVLRDTQTSNVLGVWNQGRTRLTQGGDPADSVRVAVPGYPFTVVADWPRGMPLAVYGQAARQRWAFEIGTMLLLALAAWRIAHLIGERDGSLRRERRQSALQNTLLNNALVGIALANSRHIVRANQRFAEMLGYAGPEELAGLSFATIYVSQDDYNRVGDSYAQLRSAGSAFVPGVRMHRRDGSSIICDLAGKLVDEAGAGDQGTSVWAVLDVTERHLMQDRIERLSTHDTLTGLPNRYALEQQLPLVLGRAARNGSVAAVCMIDLDDLKSVNDRWGQEAGDRLLKVVADRLESSLRQPELVARLGGDEFVIVLEDIEQSHVLGQLTRVMARLQRIVESPIEVEPGRTAEIGMSMGIALFPKDAGDGDALLRRAAEALHQAKANKATRTQWWRLSGSGGDADPAQAEPVFEPYGDEAAGLLRTLESSLPRIAADFVPEFYSRLARDAKPASILNAMLSQDMQELRTMQGLHLRFMLDWKTTQKDIIHRAQHVGRAHALVGVDNAWMVKSMSIYRELLHAELGLMPIRARARYRIMLAVEQRLVDDIQAELSAMDDTVAEYQRVVSMPTPAPGSLWADVAAADLQLLAGLPGILSCQTLRPDRAGVFQIEAAVGAPRMVEWFRSADHAPVLDVEQPAGQGVVPSAWRSARIASNGSVLSDPRAAAWHDALSQGQVRSVVAIPILNQEHQTEMVLALQGAYPNQFESPWMVQFLQGLQRRWGESWSRCASRRSARAILPQDLAQAYRRRLFAGGLTMFMQPIIDLGSGAVHKVEALARLRLEDGSIVAPGVFLPLLGTVELDHLFRLGLDQSLDMLNQWEAQGLRIDVSVNLPPSTLQDANCPRWIEEALREHGLDPERLTLELLETQDFDQRVQGVAIEALVKLGVKLAMDDLGSGYSSLKRLSLIPFDAIKIDQDLLSQLRVTPLETLRLISTLVQIGQDMNRDVVVEGLEDASMIEAVTILGASSGQGYGLARPMPADAMAEWARGFSMPVRVDTPSTLLGALAFHWKMGHHEVPMFDLDLADCPVTWHLEQAGEPDSEQARCHAALHGDGVQPEGQGFLPWLAQQVRSEGRDAPG